MMIFWNLFWTFFKIGAFTFGGGYAMLPLVEQEVLRHGWMAMEQLVDFVAVSESTPGSFAVNVSTYVGMQTAGFFGALCATLGVVLPSFLIILIVAHFMKAFSNSKVVKGCMSGLKPAVVGLIAATILSVGKTVLFPNGWGLEQIKAGQLGLSIVILAVALFMGKKKLHPILIICMSAVFGIAASFIPGLL